MTGRDELIELAARYVFTLRANSPDRYTAADAHDVIEHLRSKLRKGSAADAAIFAGAVVTLIILVTVGVMQKFYC